MTPERARELAAMHGCAWEVVSQTDNRPLVVKVSRTPTNWVYISVRVIEAIDDESVYINYFLPGLYE